MGMGAAYLNGKMALHEVSLAQQSSGHREVKGGLYHDAEAMECGEIGHQVRQTVQMRKQVVRSMTTGGSFGGTDSQGKQGSLGSK